MTGRSKIASGPRPDAEAAHRTAGDRNASTPLKSREKRSIGSDAGGADRSGSDPTLKMRDEQHGALGELSMPLLMGAPGLNGDAEEKVSPSTIGTRLRLTREVLNLTQSQVADSCAIARNTYNQYEQGKNIPQVQQAIRICETYRLTLDWIYRGDPSGLPYNIGDAIRIRRQRAP